MDGTPAALPKLRILSLACSYPHPLEPGRAPFILSRIQAVAALPGVEVKVLAPVPAIDYSHPEGRIFASFHIPGRLQNGPVEEFHPRWLFPPLGTPWNVLCLAARLLPLVLRLRRRYPFQLIDAHFGYPEGAAAGVLSAITGCPFTITIRGNEMVFAGSRLRRACLAWAFRRAARVIAVSQELRDFAVSLGTPPERAVTIPNGVHGDIFFPRDRMECRRRHGISEGASLILSAGGLGPGKGHHHVVAALKVLIGKGAGAELMIAGAENRDGSFSRQIRALVKELGLEDRVRFAGQLEPAALAEAMCAADVLCLASSAEGWPNVVNEALACGTPVVATRVGAVPQLLPSPKYGIIVPVDDPGALSEALAHALEMEWDRNAISEWGRSRSWRQAAVETVQEMRRVVSCDRGPEHSW
jgi:teichuronic acid biosynthesis glycosyltransferase TuaC